MNKKIADYQAREKEEVSSVGVSTATEEDELEHDDDMEFSSYVVPNGPSSSKKAPPSRVRDDQFPKRRRTTHLPSAGLSEMPLPELGPINPFKDDFLGADPTPFPEPPKRTSKAEDKSAKVIKMYNDKKAAFSDEILFEGKLKSRAFPALQKSVEQGANQIVGGAEYADLAKEMLEFPDTVTAKWNLFQKLAKQKLTDVLTTLEETELDLMATLRSSLVSKVILAVAGGLLKDIEDMLGSWW